MTHRITAFASTSVLAAALLLLITVPVSATDGADRQDSQVVCEAPNVHIAKGTVVRGDKGSEHVLKNHVITNGTYEVAVTATNQGSVHPNSDIIVRSGEEHVIVEDVEREAFKSAKAEGTLRVADEKVIIAVKLGEDKVFSGGVCVELKKVVAPTPTPTPANVTVDQPATLPAAGVADMLAIGAATTGLGYGAHLFAARKRK